MLSFIKKHYIIFGLILTLLTVIIGFLEWLYPKNQSAIIFANTGITNTGELNILKGSIFDVVEKILLEKTSLDKQNLLEKYTGLKATGTGYIINVTKNSQNGYFVPISLFNTGTGKFIHFTCFFDSSRAQIIETLNISNEISFEGIFRAPDSIITSVILENCKLK